ncbi:MAG: hypothetical protein Q8S20_05495 [Sulfuritalea sp.]|nr:hypothetical protein [Sulfuritalea sp.]
MVMLIGSLCLTNLIARRGKEVIRSCQFPRLSGSATYATDLDRPTNLAAALNRGYLQALAVGAADDSGLEADLQPASLALVISAIAILIAIAKPCDRADLLRQIIETMREDFRQMRALLFKTGR